MAATLEEAKAYLRIEDAAEDALITRLIVTATTLCEQFIGQVLIARTVMETVAASGEWRRLRTTPVRAITKVEGVSITGVPIVLPVDSYAIDIDARSDGWVRVPGSGRAVVIVEAGISADAAGLPDPLRQGILRLVAHLYAHRDEADEEGPPAAVVALWRPWRRMRLR